jgi:hypothetical protein
MSTHAEPMIGIISASIPFLTVGHYVKKTYQSMRRLFDKKTESVVVDREEDEEQLYMSIVEINGAGRISRASTIA